MRPTLILSLTLLTTMFGVSPADAAPQSNGLVMYYDGEGHFIGSTVWGCTSPPQTTGQTSVYWISRVRSCPTFQIMCPHGVLAYLDGAGPHCISNELVNDISCAPDDVDIDTGDCIPGG
jgi:hypothetical protein